MRWKLGLHGLNYFKKSILDSSYISLEMIKLIKDGEIFYHSDCKIPNQCYKINMVLDDNAVGGDFSILGNVPKINLSRFYVYDASFKHGYKPIIHGEKTILSLTINLEKFNIFSRVSDSKFITSIINKINPKPVEVEDDFEIDDSVPDDDTVITSNIKSEPEIILTETDIEWNNLKMEFVDKLIPSMRDIGIILLDNYKKDKEWKLSCLHGEKFNIESYRTEIENIVNIINSWRANEFFVIKPLNKTIGNIDYSYMDYDNNVLKNKSIPVSAETFKLVNEIGKVNYQTFIENLNKLYLEDIRRGATLKVNKLKKYDSIIKEFIEESRDIGRRSRESNATWLIVSKDIHSYMINSPMFTQFQYNDSELLPQCGVISYFAGETELKIFVYINNLFQDDRVALMGYREKNGNALQYICPYIIFEKVSISDENFNVNNVLITRMGGYNRADVKASYTKIRFLGIKT